MNQSQRMIADLGEAESVKVGDKVTINMHHSRVIQIIKGPGGAGWLQDIRKASTSKQGNGPFEVIGDRGMKSRLMELKVGDKTLSAPVESLKKA